MGRAQSPTSGEVVNIIFPPPIMGRCSHSNWSLLVLISIASCLIGIHCKSEARYGYSGYRSKYSGGYYRRGYGNNYHHSSLAHKQHHGFRKYGYKIVSPQHAEKNLVKSPAEPRVPVIKSQIPAVQSRTVAADVSPRISPNKGDFKVNSPPPQPNPKPQPSHVKPVENPLPVPAPQPSFVKPKEPFIPEPQPSLVKPQPQVIPETSFPERILISPAVPAVPLQQPPVPAVPLQQPSSPSPPVPAVQLPEAPAAPFLPQPIPAVPGRPVLSGNSIEDEPSLLSDNSINTFVPMPVPAVPNL